MNNKSKLTLPEIATFMALSICLACLIGCIWNLNKPIKLHNCLISYQFQDERQQGFGHCVMRYDKMNTAFIEDSSKKLGHEHSAHIVILGIKELDE
jgi:hypothetical protein